MLEQFQASEGFISAGGSQIAEATLVVHVAKEFIAAGKAVWAESPFRDNARGKTKHLDLLIDANVSSKQPPDLLVFEAKAVTSSNRNARVQQIINDICRVRKWNSLGPKAHPLFFLHSPPTRVRGMVAAILTEKLNSKSRALPPGALSLWWKSLNTPLQMKSTLKLRLKHELNHADRVVIPGRYRDGGVQRSVAWAIFL